MSWWLAVLIPAALVLAWFCLRGLSTATSEPDAAEAARFLPASGPADVDRWLADSRREPVWVFLHDPYCPISRAALRQVRRYGGEFQFVDVSERHTISRAIEQHTGVRHESPQVLLLRGGRAVWSASHYGITEKSIAEAALADQTPEDAAGLID